MVFIGLKRSSWPAGLVATAGVMLHYDLKMTGDAAAPKRRGERREHAGGQSRSVLQPACCANMHPYTVCSPSLTILHYSGADLT